MIIWPEIEDKTFMMDNKMLSKNLSLKEAVTSQTAIRKKIDNTPNELVIENLKHIAINIFQKVREHFGEPIRLSSGYRSLALNKAVGGSKSSQHVTGEALDIQGTNGLTNSQIFYYIKDNLNFDQLIWEYGDEDEPAWVHVSLRKKGNRNQFFAIGVIKDFN
jgi:hypothetical protein